MMMYDPRDQQMSQPRQEISKSNPNIRYNVWSGLVSDRLNLVGAELIAECELAMSFIFPETMTGEGTVPGPYL